MTQHITTRFKRVETKYLVPTKHLKPLLEDLKAYLTEDDFPNSTISNIYFDTPDFEVIKDALAGRNKREKIRMRCYAQKPTSANQAFLEIKQKDLEGVGHKLRLISTPPLINQLLVHGRSDKSITDHHLVQEIYDLRDRYEGLSPRIFIYYERYSLKQKKGAEEKVRVTFDKNLRYRDNHVDLTSGNSGKALLDTDHIIMEIKASKDKPNWLQEILDKHGLIQIKFSKYACAYHRSEGLDYQPRPAILNEKVGA